MVRELLDEFDVIYELHKKLTIALRSTSDIDPADTVKEKHQFQSSTKGRR